MKRVLGRVALLSLLVGCYSPGKPLLDRKWANVPREQISRATPQGDWKDVDVTLGEDDTDDLEDLDGETYEKDRKLVATLGPGTYKIVSPVTIEGGELEIRGAGPEKTYIAIDSEDARSLTVRKGRLILRDATFAGYSGGGIGVESGELTVTRCDFVGSTCALRLIASTADIASSVFVGCTTGMVVEGGSTRIRGTGFRSCWQAIVGSGKISVEGSVLDGLLHKAIAARLLRGSALLGSLFGSQGDLGWSGQPEITGCLLPRHAVGTRAKRGENRGFDYIEQFPDGLPEGLPDGLDVASVSYASERLKARGSPDATGRVDDAMRSEARRFAKLARDVMLTGDRRTARAAAKVALDFADLAADPADAREDVRDVEGLLR